MRIEIDNEAFEAYEDDESSFIIITIDEMYRLISHLKEKYSKKKAH